MAVSYTHLDVYKRQLYEIMLETEGIYGGRFSGAGFNGSSMALVDPERKEEVAAHILSLIHILLQW